jgi:ParB/RepB/Spo0J family partition protein
MACSNRRGSESKVEISSVKTEKGFNPRSYVSRSEVARLRQSMSSKLGQVAPIIIRKGDNELIDGLHRLIAARQSKRKYIEAVSIDVDDDQARRMSLAANSLTQQLHWLELGRGAAAILNGIKRHHGREKIKRELAKELGISHKTLEHYIVPCRMLSPEAWDIALELSKKHLLPVPQLSRIWQLPHEKQLLLLRRVRKMNDPILVCQHISGFLETEQVQRNPLGRPRGSSKTAANVEPGKQAQERSGKESFHNSHVDRREQTKHKLEEALGMDEINLVDLEIWKLAIAIQPRLRNITDMPCERFKVQAVLKADLELVEHATKKRIESVPS